MKHQVLGCADAGPRPRTLRRDLVTRETCHLLGCNRQAKAARWVRFHLVPILGDGDLRLQPPGSVREINKRDTNNQNSNTAERARKTKLRLGKLRTNQKPVAGVGVWPPDVPIETEEHYTLNTGRR